MSETTVPNSAVDEPDGEVDALNLTDSATDGEPSVAEATKAAAAGDERLAYRSIFQRLFIRPEIGAIIGVIGVWTFFWAVSLNFGTTGQTQNWLDTASTLGIMAVAVSMLMIGGEFDLSSGANTGAMGLLFILLIKETGDLGGLGISIWIAVPLSFAVAMIIGYFNGLMVEKTALPSFIVTLATFFILRGLKLGLAKLLTDQISVSFDPEETGGYDFWRPIFAGEWIRNENVWNGRDIFYIGLPIIGAILISLAVCEMHFARREEKSAAGVPIFGAGLAGVAASIFLMHTTDGVSSNFIAAAVLGVGVLVGLYGFATWRYETVSEAGQLQLHSGIMKFLIPGLIGVGAASVLSFVIDSNNAETLFFPFTVQGLRAVLMMLIGGVGFSLLMAAGHKALGTNPLTKLFVSTIVAGSVAGFAFVIRASSEAEKFRTNSSPHFCSLLSHCLFGRCSGFAFRNAEKSMLRPTNSARRA